MQHIKAIITAKEVFLRDPKDDDVVPIVEELRRRLPKVNCSGQGEEDKSTQEGEGGEENEFPFEFRALEVALEAICSFLDARTRELETASYPALDELTSKISSRNLDRVRKLKSAMTRLTNRVQKIRDELENLLDDDDDMAELYLSRKLVVSSSPTSNSDSPNWQFNSPNLASKIHTSSTTTVHMENDVEELEMLLEAYFMQIDGTLNKLATLREYTDDTEDYINIQCIYDKITEEELECCPICNIDLGCVPLEKLRPDHSLQDVRSKVFPLKGRKVKAPEVVPSVPLPARRKERSLSSLVVSTPKVSSSQVNMTGRRTKPTRKAGGLRASSFSIEKPIKNEDELLEDRSESSSSPDTSNKFAENTGQFTYIIILEFCKVQSLSPCEGSQSKANKPTESGAEPWDTKLDLWKPLNCLVEVASRTKSFKSSVQGSDAKLDLLQVNESDSQVKKIKNKENKRKAKVEDEKISTYSVSPDTAKPKKLRRIRRKKEPAFGESRITSQAILDSNSTKLLQNGPIWFSLVALENQ
ncbi:hypothetical protein TanjilG_28366 [Lupinus angustifolius]|uniref:Magnesium transporter n=1 Tax=Lupinus angustifolius TaxID=3871 RepID=A0A4P1RIL7_LUPAN|nr:hypothetical protein TanjilG_28366 [Lupinus angustifolius]